MENFALAHHPRETRLRDGEERECAESDETVVVNDTSDGASSGPFVFLHWIGDKLTANSVSSVRLIGHWLVGIGSAFGVRAERGDKSLPIGGGGGVRSAFETTAADSLPHPLRAKTSTAAGAAAATHITHAAWPNKGGGGQINSRESLAA